MTRRGLFPAVTSIIIATLFANVQRANAQLPPQGFQSTSLSVGGKTVTCTSGGQPVVWVANYQLQDVGHTGPGSFALIQYNPTVLLMLSDHVQLFWLGHECGHASQRTGDEMAADCWSASTGVRQGWFDPSDFAELEQDMQDNFGDSTHPPGHIRTDHIRQCMSQAGNNQPNANPQAGPQLSDFYADPEASQCVDPDIMQEHTLWHRTAANPVVDYTFPYKNSCERAVSCFVDIAIGYKPKGQSASDHSGWQLTDQRTSIIAIGAHQTRNVSGTLHYEVNRPTTTMPSLRNSDSIEDGDFAMSCKFAP
jgi:hypothetical protein